MVQSQIPIILFRNKQLNTLNYPVNQAQPDLPDSLLLQDQIQ